MTEVSESEWRSFIKISVMLKKSSSDIFRDLSLALGDEAPSRTTVFEWAARFAQGRQSVADDSREGCPRTSRTEANIEAARQLLHDYPQITIEEIAEILGISHGSAQAIVTDDLRFRKLFAKWIPHSLSPSQMAERKDTAAYLLRKLRSLKRKGQKNIATGDETWLHMDMPETRRSQRQWVPPGGQPPSITHPSMTSKKVCYALFVSSEGLLAQVPTPQNETITGHYYAEAVLPTVLKAFKAKRPNDIMMLHHDNAPAHRSGVVVEFLHTHNIAVLPHPPYSPDLAICDFWVNPQLKEHLAGCSYSTRSGLGSAVSQWFRSLSKDSFVLAFDKWQERLQKCVAADGKYFE